MQKKILIIRFSSFGDIVQAATAVEAAAWTNPNLQIHWVTRSDFASFLKNRYPQITVWELKRQDGLMGLLKLAISLHKESFDFVFDAHNNLRSLFLRSILGLSLKTRTVTRSKDRIKRILLFNFRMNLFDKPFRGVVSFWNPLAKLLQIPAQKLHDFLDSKSPKSRISHNAQPIILAPSANWEMKRWPIEHWSDLIKLFPNEKFQVLGGPQDHFLNVLKTNHPDQVEVELNLSWTESSNRIVNAKCVVSGDTGLLHVADNLSIPTVAIIGPTAFGFPIRKTSVVAEVALGCRPCTKDGRGKCCQKVYKKCLVDVTPKMVSAAVKSFFSSP